MDSKSSTLCECLSKTGIRALPPAIGNNDKRIWVNAIVLVRKMGIESYCLATNTGDGVPNITHDFGPCIAISEIVSVHPIEILDGKYTPDLRSDKAIQTFLVKANYPEAEIAGLLSKENKTAEAVKADRDKVKRYINQVAINLARKEIAERKRCAEIKAFAQKSKKQ